ncbi:uncharacterized protein CDAR_44361 [Caerostris darwini]|uniref:Uncharacterized protein n=1 Tax=Caerostris darwini TaxID=1538125 RepID=A0AAV4QQI9_9ARAC|nr:uncharacterized protein CDAR_44361 [Caerostris darwini]
MPTEHLHSNTVEFQYHKNLSNYTAASLSSISTREIINSSGSYGLIDPHHHFPSCQKLLLMCGLVIQCKRHQFSLSNKSGLISCICFKSQSNFVECPRDRVINIFENKRKYLFFISENDDLLKEGVEFFQRKNTLEQLQNDWNRKKYDVMELFRRKRKSFQRGSSIRIKASEKNKAFAKK